MKATAQRFERCPKSWLMAEAEEEAQLVVDSTQALRLRVLPHPGGLLDQSPRWLEAVQLVGAELAKLGKVIHG